LFLNDLQSFLEKENLPGLKAISEKIEENLNIYLKLFVLLYADDTVIMAESREDLQAQLNVSACFVIALLKFPVLFKSIPR
jgi:pantothenate kinase